MNRFLIVLFFLTLVSCNEKKSKSSVVKKFIAIKKQEKVIDTTQYFEELNSYFDLYKLTPSIVVNNVNNDDVLAEIGNHKIKWIDSDEETKIKIDDDLFSFKNVKALNDEAKVDFVNNWDQIQLYKYNGKEIIIVRMSFFPCNGLGCSADYFLVYDVLSKGKSYFETFRTNREIELFDFDNDDKIDYVSKTYKGDYNSETPIESIYELYSLEKDGKFKLQKDKKGLAYQIKITTFPEKLNKIDEYSEYWINSTKGY